MEAYTINSAYAMNQEFQTGSIEVGKDADFIIIDHDIFLLEDLGLIDQIPNTQVLMTVLEGEEIYKTQQFWDGKKMEINKGRCVFEIKQI